MPPPGDWYVWLILSGRGFGKSRVGSEQIRAWAEAMSGARFALVAETAADARDVLVEGESGILAISPPWFRPKYEPSKRRLTWPNGAQATTFSGEEPDQLRGPQFHKAWADEAAKWRYATEAWDNLEMAVRLGTNPQIVVTTTPRPIKLIQSFLADERTDANPQGQTVVTRGHTNENRANLSTRFVDRVIRRYEGTRLGRQELGGEVLDDNPRALWNRGLIEKGRVLPRAVPTLTRVVVGVDPQVADVKQATEETTAETGIVVAGIGPCSCKGAEEVHGFILDDRSLWGSPDEWGGAAVKAYTEHEADRIVAEVNNGGAMVEFVIGTVARDRKVAAAYKAVHASRGKQTRAEPVAALYEQGRVHHVGAFPMTEDQLCNWEPGMDSPDRLDALVWALTELIVDPEQPRKKAPVPSRYA